MIDLGTENFDDLPERDDFEDCLTFDEAYDCWGHKRYGPRPDIAARPSGTFGTLDELLDADDFNTPSAADNAIAMSAAHQVISSVNDALTKVLTDQSNAFLNDVITRASGFGRNAGYSQSAGFQPVGRISDDVPSITVKTWLPSDPLPAWGTAVTRDAYASSMTYTLQGTFAGISIPPTYLTAPPLTEADRRKIADAFGVDPYREDDQ